MKRKHSYRELAQRHFSGLVVYCLNFPDDAEENMKFMTTEKQKTEFKRAIEVSKELIKQYEKNGVVNVHQFTGSKAIIKNILRKRKQQTLTL